MPTPGSAFAAGLLQKKAQDGTQTTMEATLMAQQTPGQREQVCVRCGSWQVDFRSLRAPSRPFFPCLLEIHAFGPTTSTEVKL